MRRTLTAVGTGKGYVLGRHDFDKIDAVERRKLSPDMVDDFMERQLTASRCRVAIRHEHGEAPV